MELKLTVGKCYLLRGGHIMRYHGMYSGKGPMLAFRQPSDPVGGTPAGTSVDPCAVLFEIDATTIDFLQRRIEELRAQSPLLEDELNEALLVLDEVAGPKALLDEIGYDALRDYVAKASAIKDDQLRALAQLQPLFLLTTYMATAKTATPLRARRLDRAYSLISEARRALNAIFEDYPEGHPSAGDTEEA